MSLEPSEEDMQKKYDPDKKRSEATLGEWVEVQQARPPRIFRQTLEKYLDIPYKDVHLLHQMNPSYRSDLVRFAIHKIFSPSEIEREANFENWGSEEPIPVERKLVNTGTETFEGLVCGYYFLDIQEGKVVLSMMPGFQGSSVLEICAKDKQAPAKVVARVNQFIKDNNYLKGKKLLSNGQFLNVAKTTWDDVVLSPEMKKILQTHIIGYVERFEELRKLGLPTKRGLLIIGPPGNGKTMIGKALACNISSTFIWVPSASDYGHVYTMARELAPSTVFIEDIAAHGGLDRRAGPVDSDTAELLNMLDGVEQNDLILTVATENNPDLLDPALRNRPGRFDVIVPLPNPDVELRERVLKHYLPDTPLDMISYLANNTNGYSCAHLRELATRIVLENPTLETCQVIIDGINNTFGALISDEADKEVSEGSVVGLYGHRSMGRKKKKKKKISMSYEDVIEDLSDFEKSITPKILNLETKPIVDQTIQTKSEIVYKDGFVYVSLKDSSTGNQLAVYKCETKDKTPSEQTLGLLEALTVARFATETVINIEHTLTSPVPTDMDELLSEYGLATVKFFGDTYEILSPLEHDADTLLFSGGVDSTHLLFKSLRGDTNAVSFYHGQPSFYIGAWPEKRATQALLKIARDGFETDIPHQVLKARWSCSLPRSWAKAFRNFMMVTQAAIAFPDTRIWIGTNIQDELHDCHPDFIQSFSQLSGIEIVAPNLHTGRRELMRDLVELSLKEYPYLYASTASCQFVRFMGGKHLYCGSCHSCLLRLPGIEFGADPRFSNFNKDLKVIPQELENQLDATVYYKGKPSHKILKSFFSDFADNAFTDFIPALRYLEKAWQDYSVTKYLSKAQLDAYSSFGT